MSYAFDVLSAAWARLHKELPQEHADGEIAMRFGFLLEEMHDANHRLNDAINKDPHVIGDARRLHDAMNKADRSEP